MSEFGSILVANRGEIALRVMRTAKALGHRTIAVYSQADAGAPHVDFADEAVSIGPPSPAESYLSIERILAAAKEAGAEAIHPGYGFLSEDAGFARACRDAGLVFIGPPSEAIELMGNKAAAKRRMIEAGVACVPGYDGQDQSDTKFAEAAGDLGFPVMVKAAAGGGGRGMRLVASADELEGALKRARHEAKSAFGSDELILEKALLRPRHVEFQIFADTHGTIVHMGERDCSIQRRHQKVIEEAPCPVMSGGLRQAMGKTAVEAARAIGYEGAGTVEFLLDVHDEFYFLEMNTRLQVEHPVTEMLTGYDLVALQIAVAQGKPLGFTQNDVGFSGYAIEARLYAEDPRKNFLPSVGEIDLWTAPDMPEVRVDAGIETGGEVSPLYDPMLAKIVAWGERRDAARRKLIEALKETVLLGVATNKDFLVSALETETFKSGDATTAFIEEEFDIRSLHRATPGLEQAAMAAVLHYCTDRDASFRASVGVSPVLLNWSSSGALHTRYRYAAEGHIFDLSVSPGIGASFTVSDGKKVIDIGAAADDGIPRALRIDGQNAAIDTFHLTSSTLYLSTGGETFTFDRIGGSEAEADTGDGSRVLAPMHGTLTEVLVEPGATVKHGTRLAVLEAMKMQHEIVAGGDGTISDITCEAGTQVAAGDLLFAIDVSGT